MVYLYAQIFLYNTIIVFEHTKMHMRVIKPRVSSLSIREVDIERVYSCQRRVFFSDPLLSRFRDNATFQCNKYVNVRKVMRAIYFISCFCSYL